MRYEYHTNCDGTQHAARTKRSRNATYTAPRAEESHGQIATPLCLYGMVVRNTSYQDLSRAQAGAQIAQLQAMLHDLQRDMSGR